jgi:hypothetical protein
MSKSEKMQRIEKEEFDELKKECQSQFDSLYDEIQ